MDYEKLRNRELEHIAELLKDDKEYSKRLKDLYTRILGDLHEAIEKDINYLAKNEKLSYAEAKRIANDFDVKAFQEKAREYVRTKDFSPEANKELRKYNVALRVNRMELLEQKVNLITVDLANAEAAMLEEKLTSDWDQEIERQAGIIGMSIPKVENLKKALNASLLLDLNGVSFSERIWANQNRLRDDTTDIIRRALIQGENPKVGARKLKRNLNELYLGKRGKGGAKFVSERLAITESARAQLLADKLSYEETGFTKYVYIAELDERTCQICEQYDGLEFDVKDMGVGSPMPPVHPLCRCSVAARFDADKFNSNNSFNIYSDRNDYSKYLRDVYSGTRKLKKRQIKHLNKAPRTGEHVYYSSEKVKIDDLAALTAFTGHEFGLFQKGTHQILVHGSPIRVKVDKDLENKLLEEKWEWIGHSHVTMYNLKASDGDRSTLKLFKWQEESVIIDLEGKIITFNKDETFGDRFNKRLGIE